jgi:hypothetical protein
MEDFGVKYKDNNNNTRTATQDWEMKCLDYIKRWALIAQLSDYQVQVSTPRVHFIRRQNMIYDSSVKKLTC